MEQRNVNIFNDDCLNIIKKIPSESIDLIATDPPYPTTSRGSAGNSGGMLQKEINKKGIVFTHNNIDCSEYASEFYRILKDGSHCYVMTNHVNLIHMLNAFTDLRTDKEKEQEYPTAYDVDKVVEQLEKKIQTHECCIEYEKKNGTITEEFQQRKAVEVLKDAIEIVKQGGKEETV